MITFTSRDFWSVPADVLVNPVNCVGVMGKGLALEFKARFPQMFPPYKALCKKGEFKPGKIWPFTFSPAYCRGPAGMGQIIWNAATKDHWKEPSRYEWVESILADMRGRLESTWLEPLQVSVPALGCGNGGLCYMAVSDLICKHLRVLNHQITVFNPPGLNLEDHVVN